jgi:hypothetical protein
MPINAVDSSITTVSNSAIATTGTALSARTQKMTTFRLSEALACDQ